MRSRVSLFPPSIRLTNKCQCTLTGASRSIVYATFCSHPGHPLSYFQTQRCLDVEATLELDSNSKPRAKQRSESIKMRISTDTKPGEDLYYASGNPKDYGCIDGRRARFYVWDTFNKAIPIGKAPAPKKSK